MKISKMSYEQVYSNYFIKLPKIISTILGVLSVIVGLLDVLVSTSFLGREYEGMLASLVGTEAYTSANLAVIVWAIIAFICFYVVHLVLKISISQKIVVVDRLTQIRDK